MKRLLTAVVAATLALASVEAGAESTPGERQIALTIESTSLAAALDKWAQQSGFQIFVQDWEAAKRLTAPRLSGTFSAQAALEQLLEGTSLTYVWLNDKAVSIRKKAAPTAPAALQRTGLEGQAVPVTKFAGERSGGQSASDEPEAPRTASGRWVIDDLEEIVVTGSHIRGARGASPVLVFDRQYIERSGVRTTQQFIQSLPQNFGGGQSESTNSGLLGGAGSGLNFGQATAANLRGLGNGATLTLLNGRRLAPANIGQAVDLSTIPLGAVERIEVLTDGASAIYGSDAIAGVVNVILRDRYDGAETRASYSEIAHSSSDEHAIQQTLGSSWDGGNVLVSLDYDKRDQLSSSERDFTRDSEILFSLVPPRDRYGGLLNLSQEIAEGVELHGNALYSANDYVEQSVAFSTPFEQSVSTEQLSASAGTQTQFGSAWELNADLSYSRHATRHRHLSADFDERLDFESRVWAFDARVDGPVFAAPGGSAKVALGSQYRGESFNSTGDGLLTGGEQTRNIKSLFGELLLPIFSRENSTSAVERLELTVALRHEDYSDFGTTTNPKVGLLWAPVTSISLRGTYGTSFRAPLLYELNETADAPVGYLATVADAAASDGDSAMFIVYGNNANLEPEKATFWTLGVDIHSDALPGLSASVTYFDIDYSDRILIPNNDDLFNALLNEGIYASIITRNPSAELVSRWPLGFNFDDPDNPTLENVEVLFDNRLTNIARTRESGLDLTVSYELATDLGTFALQLDGTYLLSKESQVTASAPFIDDLNRVATPADLKMRNSVSWSRGSIGAALFVNYVDGYLNSNFGFEGQEIDSWTTVDLAVRYTGGSERRNWLTDADASLAVTNLLDEAPPFVGNQFNANFDPTNASAQGRTISFVLTKRW